MAVYLAHRDNAERVHGVELACALKAAFRGEGIDFLRLARPHRR